MIEKPPYTPREVGLMKEAFEAGEKLEYDNEHYGFDVSREEGVDFDTWLERKVNNG